MLLTMSKDDYSGSCGEIKETESKRAGVYQDCNNGRLCMVDVETMIKALRWLGFLDS